MDTITHNVADLAQSQRESLEAMVGRRLQSNQQIVIKIISVELQTEEQDPPKPPSDSDDAVQLPDWCDVYVGLSDEEVSTIESSITRSDLSRDR
ncbi:MAG: hypothetical protein ACI9HK_004045 [Pirellulaceae bacterium]|jgi:hypothetical protein